MNRTGSYYAEFEAWRGLSSKAVHTITWQQVCKLHAAFLLMNPAAFISRSSKIDEWRKNLKLTIQNPFSRFLKISGSRLLFENFLLELLCLLIFWRPRLNFLLISKTCWNTLNYLVIWGVEHDSGAETRPVRPACGEGKTDWWVLSKS